MIKYKKKYTDKSFDIDKCRESAESGYAPAQYQLGECLETGTHVSRNLSKAFNWYWQAYDHCRLANEKLDSGSFYSNLARWLKNAVNDIVQCLNEHAEHHRHGHRNQKPPHTHRAHFVFDLDRIFLN